jgi:hypothetical protein
MRVYYGDLSSLGWLEQSQHFVGAAAADVFRPAMDKVDVRFGVVGLLDTGVHLGAVEQAAELVELGHVDELPLYELLFVVVEVVLFAQADGRGLFKSLTFVGCRDEAELFVKLRGVVAFAANDPENDLC